MSSRTIFSVVVLITAVIVVSFNEAQGSYFSEFSDYYSDEDWDWMPGEAPPDRSDEVGKREAIYTDFGKWGDWDYCPYDYYALTAQVKFEDHVHSGDDSAANGIKLQCVRWNDYDTKFDIKSAVGGWGEWKSSHGCKRNSRIVGFTLGVEPYQGHCSSGYRCDDTATSNLRIHCGLWRNGRLQEEDDHEFYYAQWGKWQERHMCPPGGYVCGIQTQIDNTGNPEDAAHGHRDITGLNSVRMACCSATF